MADHAELAQNPKFTTTAYGQGLIKGWPIEEAFKYVSSEPTAAEKIFRNHQTLQARLGLALALRFSSNAKTHKKEIKDLLDGISSADIKDGRLPVDMPDQYDGSIAALVDYMRAAAGSVAFSCKLFQKYPELLPLLGGYFYNSTDAFTPRADCEEEPHLPIPHSVQEYTKAAFAYDGEAFDRCTGTMRSGYGREFWLARLKRGFFPRTLLSSKDTTLAWTKLGEIPLHTWAYDGLWNWHAYLHTRDLFLKAREDLYQYYQANFGLAPDEAMQAAHNGLWQDMVGWAWNREPEPDPVRKAILEGVGTDEIVKLLANKKNNDPQASEENQQTGHHKKHFVGRANSDSLLLLAVERPEVENLLLKNGEDVNQQNLYGKTALMAAAQSDNLDTVQLLIKNGANVNAASYPPDQIQGNDPIVKDRGWGGCGNYRITNGGRTSLMYAAANASLPAIKALLEAGADKSKKDSEGKTALDYSMGNGPGPANPKLEGADLEEAKKLLAN